MHIGEWQACDAHYKPEQNHFCCCSYNLWCNAANVTTTNLKSLTTRNYFMNKTQNINLIIKRRMKHELHIKYDDLMLGCSFWSFSATSLRRTQFCTLLALAICAYRVICLSIWILMCVSVSKIQYIQYIARMRMKPKKKIIHILVFFFGRTTVANKTYNIGELTEWVP